MWFWRLQIPEVHSAGGVTAEGENAIGAEGGRVVAGSDLGGAGAGAEAVVCAEPGPDTAQGAVTAALRHVGTRAPRQGD